MVLCRCMVSVIMLKPGVASFRQKLTRIIKKMTNQLVQIICHYQFCIFNQMERLCQNNRILYPFVYLCTYCVILSVVKKSVDKDNTMNFILFE